MFSYFCDFLQQTLENTNQLQFNQLSTRLQHQHDKMITALTIQSDGVVSASNVCNIFLQMSYHQSLSAENFFFIIFVLFPSSCFIKNTARHFGCLLKQCSKFSVTRKFPRSLIYATQFFHGFGKRKEKRKCSFFSAYKETLRQNFIQKINMRLTFSFLWMKYRLG